MFDITKNINKAKTIDESLWFVLIKTKRELKMAKRRKRKKGKKKKAKKRRRRR